MSLEEHIHNYWSNNPECVAVLDAQRLVTGPSYGIEMPYVNLVVGEIINPVTLNSRNAIREIVFNFEVHHRYFEAGRDIATFIIRTFDKLRLECADSCTLIIRNTGWTVTFKSENHWIFKAHFIATG